jgi:hypothetical protein
MALARYVNSAPIKVNPRISFGGVSIFRGLEALTIPMESTYFRGQEALTIPMGLDYLIFHLNILSNHRHIEYFLLFATYLPSKKLCSSPAMRENTASHSPGCS